ncbi:integrase core domain-containing protein [Pseudonocardia lacus]|uniref:integrase core domain-containing protein n=1 Tax=Pseudonocardia lacus TaxID=2835865 RepID=UPI001BDCD3C5|nr:integrase core domain-containing protein [Pseudonocardia lacus]
MPTTRFCQVIGVPERTWRRWQARTRTGAPLKGPWPRPARERARQAARRHALAHPAWGHRKVWAMCRHDGLPVSHASVLRLLRDEGLLLEANYQRERRQLAARRKAAFALDPTRANQVRQLDFTEFETSAGGIWRLAGCRDHWSKYELGWHVSPTANQHDAIAAIELALAQAARLAGAPLIELAQRDPDGAVQPVVTIVTDNGGPFRSFRFEAFIATHPELRHVRTRVRSPRQNGSRERGFGTLKYERLFLEDIPDALDLISHAEAYRVEYNTVRPHEHLAWNRPAAVHTGLATPGSPTFPSPKSCQLLDAGHHHPRSPPGAWTTPSGRCSYRPTARG